jgi:hypothetical protein
MSAASGTDTPDAPRSGVRWWRWTAEGVVIVVGVPTLLRAGLYDGGGGEAWRMQAVIVVLALLALWVSWRLRAPAPDGPSGLLGLAVAVTPGSRHEWGAAMTAELAGLTGRLERWRFALSCVPAALFPPRRARRAASTPAPLRRLAAPPALVLGGLGIAAVAYLVVRYSQPEPVGVTPVNDPVVLSLSALGFGAAIWVAVATPGTLGTDKTAFQVGLGTGLAMGLLTFAAGPFPILLGVVSLPWVTAAVAAQRHSFRSGVRAAVWVSAFTTLACIPAFVVGALASFARTGEIWYGDGVQRAGIIEDLANWVVPWTIGALLPVMVVGAALGAVFAPGRRTEAFVPRTLLAAVYLAGAFLARASARLAS